MVFIWCFLIIAIFSGGFFVLFKKLKARHFSGDVQLAKNQQVLEAEVAERTAILQELAQLSLGFTSPETAKQFSESIAAVEEELRSERGRLTITEAEIEAVDTRLRELEELRRELEMSNIDAVREVELLKAQEKELKLTNDSLRQQIEEAKNNVQLLLAAFPNVPVVQERLNEVQKELASVEEKINFYQDGISAVNEKYVLLKRAYDALDIEYAQLYEKQQAATR